MSTSTVVPVLVDVALKSALVLAVAAMVDLAILRRRVSASVRYIVWTVAIAGVLIVPVAALTLPPLGITALGSLLPDSPPSAFPDTGSPERASTDRASWQPLGDSFSPPVADIRADRLRAEPSRYEPPIVSVPPAAAGVERVNVASLLVVGYGIGVLLIVVRIIVDYAIVARITRNAREVSDVQWASLLRALARRSSVRAPIRLLRTSDAVMPMTTGVLHPRIVVPDTADAWPTELKASVLLHELAHVGRRDCLTQQLAAFACALYWPNPLIWWAAARLRVERELACDDLVLERGVQGHDYASHLLEIARGFRAPRLAVSMAATRGLETRLRALIDETRRRQVPARRRVVACSALTFGLVGALAAARPSQPATRPPERFGPNAPVPAPSLSPVLVRAELPAPRLTVASAAVATLPTQARAVEHGDFTVRLAAPGDGPRNAGRIHVMLQTPGLNTFYELAARLEGLSANQLMLSGTPLEFRLRRDAGTFRFTGVARDGRGTGRFEFTHDPGFIDSLARRGIRAPTARQQFSFARHDVSLAYIDAFLNEGYAVPTPEQLDRAGMSSVDLEYVREMAALGYRVGTIDALVGMSNRGVTPSQIRSLAALGYRNLDVRDLVTLDDHDIDSVFIRDANSSAGRQLDVRELIARRLGRPTPAASSAAPATPTPSEPERRDAPVFDDTVATGKWTLVSRGEWLQLDIEWANVNQWRRFVRPSDLRGLTGFGIVGPTPTTFRIEQDAGIFSFEGVVERGRGSGSFSFAPNRAFAETLRSLGVRDVGVVGVHSLKNLAFGFIDAASIRGFLAAGLAPMTLDDVVSLAVRQVTPAYLRELKSLGVGGIETADDIIEVRFADVPITYVREINALGYDRLAYRDLMDMHRAGVSAAFIRQQQATGRRNLTPAELIDLRRSAR